MVKRQVNLYLDVDMVERHKLAGTNMSHVCNEFLKTYFTEDESTQGIDWEKERQDLQARLAKANAELTIKKEKDKLDDVKVRKQKLTVAIVKLRELNYKKQNGSLISAESYKALFDATMIEFELTRQELADKVL